MNKGHFAQKWSADTQSTCFAQHVPEHLFHKTCSCAPLLQDIFLCTSFTTHVRENHIHKTYSCAPLPFVHRALPPTSPAPPLQSFPPLLKLTSSLCIHHSHTHDKKRPLQPSCPAQAQCLNTKDSKPQVSFDFSFSATTQAVHAWFHLGRAVEHHNQAIQHTLP